MATKDGGPAFPQHLIETRDGHIQCSYDVQDGPGMSLRDYFAAKALTGMYASGGHRTVFAAIASEPEAFCMNEAQIGAIAEARIAAMAYATADAMLAEREK